MNIQKITKNMDVTYYVTSDGMTWTTEAQATYRERQIQDCRIEKDLHEMELKFPIMSDVLDGRWYLVSNAEQADYFERKYTDRRNYDYVNRSEKERLDLGDWVAVEYEYTDDGKSHCGVITLEWLLEQMKNFIAEAESITVEGKY